MMEISEESKDKWAEAAAEQWEVMQRLKNSGERGEAICELFNTHQSVVAVWPDANEPRGVNFRVVKGDLSAEPVGVYAAVDQEDALSMEACLGGTKLSRFARHCFGTPEAVHEGLTSEEIQAAKNAADLDRKFIDRLAKRYQARHSIPPSVRGRVRPS